jgi:hypothetical protein
VTYRQSPNEPGLVASKLSDDPNVTVAKSEFVAQAWTAANDKARIFDVDELKRAALAGLPANRQRNGTRVRRVRSLAMKPPSLISVLCSLYASDIKVSICISSFWDDGWEVKLGDTVSGVKAGRTFANAELDKAAHWLAEQASLHYPESDFARRFVDFKERSPRGAKSRLQSVGKKAL